MSETPDITSDLTRRTVLRRAAVAGLLAAPTAGLLSGCIGGDADTEDKSKDNQGTKTTENPLGVKEDSTLEVVIFNGGLGTKYAEDAHIPSYKQKFPKAQVKFSSTEEVATVLQPRFARNDPPDMVNNAGAKMMDQGALVQAGQVQDLTELFDAPSLDIPGKKVRETLVPGAIEQGTLNGKPYLLNYAYTVFGLWYDSELFAKKGWTPAKNWTEFTALLDKIKSAGILPFSYAGANAAYYQYLVILTSAAKLGGADVLKAIDNLEDGAWTSEPVKQAAAAWAQIGAKYGNKAHMGLKHTEVQLQQNQGKVAFYPSGSWLENEQGKDTPTGFKYAVTPVPSLTASDKLPFTGIYAAAGEMYFVGAKGKNPRGGMEYLRHMLSKAGARAFTEKTKVMTVVQGAADGLEISPGFTSANTMLGAAGSDCFSYRWPDLYKKLGDECFSATNALMFQGGSADTFCTRMQKAADEVKKDPSIEKFNR